MANLFLTENVMTEWIINEKYCYDENGNKDALWRNTGYPLKQVLLQEQGATLIWEAARYFPDNP